MDSVESVLMDALKYAHHILIEKINKWKQIQERQQLGSSSQPIRNPDGMTATPIMNRLPGEYCDRGAKHDMAQVGILQITSFCLKLISFPHFKILL